MRIFSKNRDDYNSLEKDLGSLIENHFQKELEIVSNLTPPPFRKPLQPEKTSWMVLPSKSLKLALAVSLIILLAFYPLASYLFALEGVYSPLLESTLNPLNTSIKEKEGLLWAYLLEKDPTSIKLFKERVAGRNLNESLLVYIIAKKAEVNPNELIQMRELGHSWRKILINYGISPLKELIEIRREVNSLKKLIEQSPLVVEGEVSQIDAEKNAFTLNTFPYDISYEGVIPVLLEKVEVEVKKDNGNFKAEALKLKLKESLPSTELTVSGKVKRVDVQKGVFYLEGNNIPFKAKILPQVGDYIKGKGRLKGVVIEFTY